MRIPMKVDYGVRALVDLAQHYGEGPVHTAQIASRQGIPEAYLDQLLTTLNKFGFIRSRRGPQGGHSLAKDPGEIDLGTVMVTLEGNIPALDCLTEPNECMLSSTCAQREVWQAFDDALIQVLRSTSIADLARRQWQLQTTPSATQQPAGVGSG